jgi:hypothetical protein
MFVTRFPTLATLFSFTLSLVAAANPRLMASRDKAVSDRVPRDLASGPISSVCPGIVPGAASSPGVVRTSTPKISAFLISSQSYYNGKLGGCPFKNLLDADGSCASHMETAVGLCSAYCEVRNTFAWGQEIPTGVTCQANDSTCSLAESRSISVTHLLFQHWWHHRHETL